MKKIDKIKNIISSYPILVIAFMTLLKPDVIYNSEVINWCFNIFDIILGIIIVVVSHKEIFKSKITMILFLEIAILLISTIINNNNIVYALKFYIPFIILFLYLEFLITSNKSRKMFNSICIVTGIFCIINFITVLMNSNIGSTDIQDRMYFLGYDNSMASILIMTAFLFILTSKLKFKKIKNEYMTILIIIVLTCFMIRSATAKIGATMLIVFIMLTYKKNILSKINYYVYLMVVIIMFLCIVIFRNQAFFKGIVVDVLQRDLTFSGRTQIWDMSMNEIQKNPIFGMGVSKMEERNEKIGIYHAHSTFLNVALEGGIIYLSVYLLKLIVIGKKLNKTSNLEYKSIVSFAIFIYYVMGIGEVYVRNQLLYIFFYSAYYGEKIIREFSKKNITVISSNDNQRKNAGPKAPEDINIILNNNYNDVKVIKIYRDKFFKIKVVYNFIKTCFSDNIVIIQFPMVLKKSVYKILNRNKKIILIHDIAGLRMGEKEILEKEIEVFKCFDYVIVHNKVMKRFLENNGIQEEKIFELELFDYLCDESGKKEKQDSKGIVFAGNLAKSEFLNEIEEDNINFEFNLYGIGYNKQDTEKIKYKGSYEPEVLPSKLEGKLGLVWDGKCDESDEDITYKRYTKYNNPHKLSCYLAAGLPVIVWKKAAIAKFVEENNIGYLINNIYEINDIDYTIYNEKVKNVNIIKKRVKEGYYTKKVIEKIIIDIENGEKQ